MSATAPLWVTVLLAISSPVLTLAGVLWTQQKADARAERDAEMRIAHEREKANLERAYAVYDDTLSAAMTLAESVLKPVADYSRAYLDVRLIETRARAIGKNVIADCAAQLTERAAEAFLARRSENEAAEKTAIASMMEQLRALEIAVRDEVTSMPTTGVKSSRRSHPA